MSNSEDIRNAVSRYVATKACASEQGRQAQTMQALTDKIAHFFDDGGKVEVLKDIIGTDN